MKSKRKNFRFNKLKEFQFAGNKYTIQWLKEPFKSKNGKVLEHRAETDAPETKKEIRIAPSAHESEISLLEVLIDEGIHAINFDLSNPQVDIISDYLAAFLHKCGLRFKKVKKK